MSYPFAYTGSKLGFGRTAGSDSPAATQHMPMIGYDYFQVMNVPVLAGRAFSRDWATSRRWRPLPRACPRLRV